MKLSTLFPRTLSNLLFGLLTVLSLSAQGQSLVTQAMNAAPSHETEQVRASLKINAPDGIAPGKTFWIGVLLEHQPEWHTYWQNPGDSGLATKIEWKLPPGLKVGELQWPLPKKIPVPPLANYGYEGVVLLAAPVQVEADFQAQAPVPLAAHVEWLACRQECIPQEADLQLNWNTASINSPNRFDWARQLSPAPSDAQVQTEVLPNGKQVRITVNQLPKAWLGHKLTLLPITAGVIQNAAVQDKDWTQKWQGEQWQAVLPVSEDRGESPTRMAWVLAHGADTAPQGPALTMEGPVVGKWPILQTAAVSPELERALRENAAGQTPASTPVPTTWLLALLGAFVGGMILNLMPCVFPVLAIKVMGFARPAEHPGAHLRSGLAYTAGVVLSFVALGGLLLALRATGEQLGWGFQLQSPPVIIALAVLFTLLALNLAGVFEFGMFLPDHLANLQSAHGTLNAALSGVLAVAIASPCTAPFMGASLGLAIARPAALALPIFAAMGLGMALPYLLASVWPRLVHALPRPGAWMETFRQAMAFPMWATVIWLVWVLGQQTNIDTVTTLLVLLLGVGLLMWSWSKPKRTRMLTSGLAALMIGVSGQVLWSQAQQPEPVAQTSASQTSEWQPWSPAAVQSAVANKQPVFVDFTAAWCVTCQYNKKITLANPSLLSDFKAHQVLLLRADWTRRDSTITRELNALGRSGVPVYVLYAPGKEPQLFSELPSVEEIRTALSLL
ncbi:MAG: Thiol:disulfide interchange protein DsbD precursor [Pseudomonadota bacterium]